MLHTRNDADTRFYVKGLPAWYWRQFSARPTDTDWEQCFSLFSHISIFSLGCSPPLPPLPLLSSPPSPPLPPRLVTVGCGVGAQTGSPSSLLRPFPPLFLHPLPTPPSRQCGELTHPGNPIPLFLLLLLLLPVMGFHSRAVWYDLISN